MKSCDRLEANFKRDLNNLLELYNAKLICDRFYYDYGLYYEKIKVVIEDEKKVEFFFYKKLTKDGFYVNMLYK